jgi:hypothetical protein
MSVATRELRRPLICSILCLLLSLAWLRCPAESRGQDVDTDPANLDVVLLIDNSWSMSQEDPTSGAPATAPRRPR